MFKKTLFTSACALSLMATTSIVSAAGPRVGISHEAQQPTASASTSGCAPSKSKFASISDNFSTTSTSFVIVPAPIITFTQGSSGCVIVNFSSEAFVIATAPDRETMQMTVLLDESRAFHPEGIYFAGDDNIETSAHAFNFVLPVVSAGSHTVEVEISSLGGNQVSLGFRSLIVQHK